MFTKPWYSVLNTNMEDQKQLNKINTLRIPQNKVFHGNKDKIAEYYLKFPSPTIQLLLFQDQQQSQFPIVGFLISHVFIDGQKKEILARAGQESQTITSSWGGKSVGKL